MAGPQDLKMLADRAVAEIAASADDAALEAARVRYLGRKDGAVTQATKQIATLPASEKPAYGAAVNEARARIEAALESRGAALRGAKVDQSLGEREDLTLSGRPVRIGRLHPVSAAIRDVSRIFATMGFETVEGPEIETDYYNFEALNIPPGHPAREKWDTLWVSNPLGDDPRSHSSDARTRRRCRCGSWNSGSRRSVSSFRAGATGMRRLTRSTRASSSSTRASRSTRS